MVSPAPRPGILYVTMSPKDSLPQQQFHNWYNNEHGPLRLKLPFIHNGFRYRAIDLASAPSSIEKPEWMAIYDVSDMTELTKSTYLSLRTPEVQSNRESATMAQITVNRKFFDLYTTKSTPDFKPLETMGLPNEYVDGSVMFAGLMTLKPEPGAADEFNKWYEEEHVPLIAKVPGFRRARRFTSSTIEPDEEVQYLALYDFAAKNTLFFGEEFKAAVSTRWREEVVNKYVDKREYRGYNLYYILGPGPRDLAVLDSPGGKTKAFTSNDKLTRTLSHPHNAIESYITTADGLTIPYRLEGSTSPTAPVLVFSNSILSTYSMWDSFLTHFLPTPTGSRYRILRYNARGRSAVPDTPVTFDLLSADVITLLDALRIERAACLLGVSFGGCTALNTALTYPHRVASFVACDFPPTGSGSAVWEERFTLVAADSSSVPLPAPAHHRTDKTVGQKLAVQTLHRWFTPSTLAALASPPDPSDTALIPMLESTRAMISQNSFSGLQAAVHALYGYDLGSRIRSRNPAETPPTGMFVVGAGDGPLPGVMEGMARAYGPGTECVVIDGAAHLPMVERPREFCGAVVRFLGGAVEP